MMEANSLTVRGSNRGVTLLDGVSLSLQPGSMNAVIGPSGCGKTTLVRALVGLADYEGEAAIDGQMLSGRQDRVGRVGYVAQFCVAHTGLTVGESIHYSLRLLDIPEDRHGAEMERILGETGLRPQRDQLVGCLSGGQLRRMALALELVPDPSLLFCDEVTAGLDPESEKSILDLIAGLVSDYGKTTVNVIHNLHHLHRFDWIVVLLKGKKIFEGDFNAFCAWFDLEEPVRLFRRLEETEGEVDWIGKWEQPPPPTDKEGAPTAATSVRDEEAAASIQPVPASFWAQTRTLLHRRQRLFFRDRGFLWLTLAISFGFPLLVVVFALDGIPQLERFSMESGTGIFGQMQGELRFARDAAPLGSLVSSLILFQVVLLTLTGSNNGAREISGERDLYLQESLRGLRSGAYCTEKLVFTGIIAVMQGLLMTAIVKTVCHFPGSWLVQGVTLSAVSLALSWLALGFSAWMKSSEKASLLAVYVVGFQLPLSGIVLSLPEPFNGIVRMVITTYWGWASYLGTFRKSSLYDAAVYVSNESVPPVELSLFVLGFHILAAALLVLSGVSRLRR